ncbi:MAG: hypothetical protein P8M80_12660 [Pirellulaceae bacterium]|nr:hypothetical protein [Pirellulaceae bacterium]
MKQRVFYIGSDAEVTHHAQPLMARMDIEIISPEKITEQANENDLAIFFSEHFHRFRTAIETLKQKQCRTIYAVDGILEWRNAFENKEAEPACPWTMRPVLCHKVACIGRSQVRQLAYWGNRNKIELVGLPRLDGWQSSKAATSGISNEIGQPDQIVDSANPKPAKVMVMTAKWAAFTEEQLQFVRRSLLDLKQWFEDFNATQSRKIDVIWRLTGGLAESIGVKNSMTDTVGGELNHQMNDCDCLITTPSTAVLEGMLTRLPTAVLEYNPSPQLTHTVWEIRHPAQINPVITELLDPPARKLAHQEYCLHDALECPPPESNTDGNHNAGTATDRLETLVKTMLSYPTDQMPNQIVPVAQSPFSSRSDSNFLMNGHQLFETNSLREAQAHAAQLERDVARLEKRNAILEREFKRAKRTIKNVAENPIISPLLKVGNIAGKIFKKPTS